MIPALMLLFLVVVQLGLWAHAAQVAQLSASEGDRAARAAGGGSAAGVARAASILGSSTAGLATWHLSTRLDPGDVVRVDVSGTATSILPGLSFPVSASHSGPVQEFRTSG